MHAFEAPCLLPLTRFSPFLPLIRPAHHSTQPLLTQPSINPAFITLPNPLAFPDLSSPLSWPNLLLLHNSAHIFSPPPTPPTLDLLLILSPHPLLFHSSMSLACWSFGRLSFLVFPSFGFCLYISHNYTRWNLYL